MRILVTGASGLVGSRLVKRLGDQGHVVLRLGRSHGDIRWDPPADRLDAAALEGFDAVVHLAGESIASGRWTNARKTLIRDSRITGTRLLAERLALCSAKPKVLVSASAIGYYGHRGDEAMTEAADPGTGFLPEVCVQWEHACEPARRAGVRTVNLRIGVVLAAAGGALAKMLTPFKLCLGGPIGSGGQYMSWISLTDLVAVIEHAALSATLEGPVNAVAPEPVTNRQFTRTLGRVLGRPTVFPMPAFAARLAFGEMADALLLASTRVVPRRLQASGYAFKHGDLESALRAELGR